ncbi:hypothetical protein Ddye_005477 [Dipteronia dyeriana]|uniref:Uncharacterized protein n=1 Tax=Dipteronia dyeriana TaxID=168575 RepID=A0AAE0CPT4_9ROSI|nr:hypothetical protein Ddye_005477 [Dipteronia dyeriana]
MGLPLGGDGKNEFPFELDCPGPGLYLYLLVVGDFRNDERRIVYGSFQGLRQGFLLSTYLFILYVEALSNLIKKYEKSGRMLGVRCWKGSPLVSRDSCLLIRNPLAVYERGSGQQVNLYRSYYKRFIISAFLPFWLIC